MDLRRLSRLLLVGAALLLAGGCKDKAAAGGDPSAGGRVSLNGAGATFPFPLYSKWMAEYNRQHPDVRINYQSIGSGGGIRQIIAGTVDFGATDAPMTEDEAKKAPRPIVHIPTTLGAVAVTYNVPGVTQALKLTPEVLAEIYLGTVSKWNDPKLAGLNPGVSLPDKNISVVYRSDGSGTTAVFSEYLAKVSSAWKEKVGVGKSVKWPTGLGAKGNEGVTGQVKTTPGSVGYVELAYATQNEMPVAAIKNQAGEFVEPKLAAVSAAAKGQPLPESLHVSITNPPGQGAYPIASYTYLLVYEDMKEPREAQALAGFLWWAIHDGQKFAEALHYAPLPPLVVAKVEARLKDLTANGKKLLAAN